MWIYKGKEIDEAELVPYIGFVYMISRIDTGKMYIGKKMLKFKKTKQIKGKKKRILVDSDWKKYWGSNKYLIEEVKSVGENKFVRTILRLCKTRGEMNYIEAKFQFEYEVLESDKFYNDWIFVKVHRSHLRKIFVDNSHKLI
jgi:hypothetical protein